MLVQDIRYSVRTMRKNPVFTLAAVATLALGIGANTAIFSIVNAVLIRPLPYETPARLIRIAEKNDRLNLTFFSSSVLNYLSWKEQSRTFQQMGAIGSATFALTGKGDPEQVTGSTITPSLMDLLGLRAAQGRNFRQGEDLPGSPPVALLSQSLWKRRFGADPTIIGRTVSMNDIAVTIVGIAPPALALLASGDIWTPLTIDPPREIRLNHVITTVGMLKLGVTVRQAQAEMDVVARQVGMQYPEVKDWGIQLQPFFNLFVSDQLQTSLIVLLAAVAFVLLIACGNVANLMLSRAASREKEIAVRTAMGASRARLVRQLLTESLLLSAIGGACGILAATLAVHSIGASLPPSVLPVNDLDVDRHVLLFALAATLIAGVLLGLAPAWQTARTDWNGILKQGGRGSTGGSRPLLRQALVAGELALATVLVIGAGLLIQTLARLQSAPLGFEPSHLLTFQLSPPASRYSPPKRWAFYQELLARLRSIPGVRAAALSTGIPLGAGNYNRTPTAPVGKSLLPADASIPIDWRAVSPEFFSAMRTPLVKGREFTDRDTVNSPAVAIVSQETVRKLWGTEDPIGRVIRAVASGKQFNVVGVVGDVRMNALNQEPFAAMYFPASTRLWPASDLVVRTAGKPLDVLSAVRSAVHDLDAELPVSTVRTMDDWVYGNAAQPRLNGTLLAAFAAMALLIAAIGIYGVLSYSVNQRTREIGLRMALGAQPAGVRRMVVGEGMRMAIGGILLGLAAAVGVSRVIASLLFNVQPRDPVTFLAVAAALLIVSFAACYVPARRATRVDPLVALRDE